MNDYAQFDLQGTVILVTGGAGFLGKIFGEALAGAGGTVILGDLSEAAAVQAAKSVAPPSGGTVAGMNLDVTKKQSIDTAIAGIIDQYGRLDVVINNAGIDPKFDATVAANDKTFEKYPEDHIRKSLEVNLLGATLVAQVAVECMVEQKGGVIINISSLYGMLGPDQRIYPQGTQKPVDYSIAKGGLVMLTRWLATSYACKGIRANTLTLGGVLHDHPKEFQKTYGNKVPNGKMVVPEEVGGTIIYLASSASTAMNGHNLVLDHGFSVW